MMYLLDTHIIMWALLDHPYLPDKARELIGNNGNKIYYSTVSIWETEIKHIKKPDKIAISGARLAFLCEQAGFINLEIKNKHVKEIGSIEPDDPSTVHNDPFDKMLLAQARSEEMILITHDGKFTNYTDHHLLNC